jgi:hypothetical protein
MTAVAGRLRLTAAESLWYVLGCIAFGGMYLAKVPAKKALSEAGLAKMTGAERFWYVLQCIAFGAGYLAKVPVKRALTEMIQVPAPGDGLGSGPAPAPGPAGAYGARTAVGDQWAGLPDGQHQSRHGDRGGQV